MRRFWWFAALAAGCLAVSSCSSGGNSPPPPVNGPSAPTGLVAAAIAGNSVQIAWTPSSSFSSYRIYRDNTEIGSTTGASFTDTAVTPGATYVYFIRGVAGSSLSPNSATLSVTTPSSSFVALSVLADRQNRQKNFVRDVAFDGAGNIYVTGGAWDANFPTTAGAYDRTFATGGASLGNEGPADAFVMKLDRNGNVIWSTFLGGPNYDRGYAIEIAPDGNVLIAGRAGEGFPTTAGVVQPAFRGDSKPNPPYGRQDGFVAKLSADGSTLIWATYFGDAASGIVRDIAVDSQNRIYVAAVMEQSIPFITGNALQSSVNGTTDLVYARLSADGANVQYATFLGGVEDPTAPRGTPSIRVGANGDTYVLTSETGNGAPTTTNAFQRNNAGGADYLLARFNTGDQLVYATYLGGSGNETLETHQLAVDSAGRAIVAATCSSNDYPTTAGVYQPLYGGGGVDGCISKISADGSQLFASTYFGGTGIDELEGVGVDASGAVYVSGATRSSGLSTTSNAMQRRFGGVEDGVLAIFSSDLQSAPYRSFIGGADVDTLRTLSVAQDGAVAFGGLTESMNYPVTIGSPTTTPANKFTGVIGLFSP